jgi:uncharacterized FlgJ-related protein
MASIDEIRELLNDVFDAKLGIGDGQSLNDVFDAKLSIRDGNSVNLPKMERQLQDLTSVVPDAVLRGVASNDVGMGTPSIKANANIWNL